MVLPGKAMSRGKIGRLKSGSSLAAAAAVRLRNDLPPHACIARRVCGRADVVALLRCRDRRCADRAQQPAHNAGRRRHREYAWQRRARGDPTTRRALFRVSRHGMGVHRGVRRSAGGISAPEIQRAQHPRHRRFGARRRSSSPPSSATACCPACPSFISRCRRTSSNAPRFPRMSSASRSISTRPRRLELALRLQPDARRLVIVLGAAERDRIWEQRLRKAVGRLEGPVEIEYLPGLAERGRAAPAGCVAQGYDRLHARLLRRRRR